MRVSLAIQLLSHSVAAALLTYLALKKLPKEVRHTAEFVERMNRIFDMGNSISPDGQGHKAPITAGRLHKVLTQLEEDIRWIEGWRFLRHGEADEKAFEFLPFKKGLLVTLSSFRVLAQRLIEEKGFSYVLTRRLNQDSVENVFATMRRDGGGFNDNPEVPSAVQRLRMIACTKLIDPCVSSFSNCEATGEAMLIELGKHFTSTGKG